MPTWQPKFDTFLLHDPGNGLYVEKVRAPRERRIATEDVSRRHGSVLIEEVVYDKRRVTIEGAIRKATAANLRSALDDLERALGGVQEKKLYLWDDRYINAISRSWDPEYGAGAGLLFARYTAEFECEDPFWYDASATSDVQVVTSAPTSATSWTSTNPGSRLVYPTITITANVSGNISAFALANITTGKSFTFSGTVLSGNSLIVNCAARTVTNNGNNALANWPSGNIFWWLNPGANTVRLTGANATVTIAYNAPYYVW